MEGPHFLSISLALPGLDEVWSDTSVPRVLPCGCEDTAWGGAVLRMATRVGLPPTEAMSTPELIPGGPGCVLTSPALRGLDLVILQEGQEQQLSQKRERKGEGSQPALCGGLVRQGLATCLPACAQTFSTCSPEASSPPDLHQLKKLLYLPFKHQVCLLPQSTAQSPGSVFLFLPGRMAPLPSIWKCWPGPRPL